jgi:hypothetical protein
MNWRRFINLLCYSAMALLLPVFLECVKAQHINDGTHLQRRHRAALQKWLVRRPELRLATEADCMNKVGLASAREENGTLYHPYYVVGDFNKDVNDDFAVALIDKRKREWRYSIAIFNGQANGDFVPAYFDGGFDLSDGGLFYMGYGRGDRLAAGVFASDQCFGFQVSGKGYVKYPCAPE